MLTPGPILRPVDGLPRRAPGIRVLLYGFETFDLPQADGALMQADSSLRVIRGDQWIRDFDASEWISWAPLAWRPEEVIAVLDELCADLGYCLPRGDKERLSREATPDVEALADEVLTAEGFDPRFVETNERAEIVRRIGSHYWRRGRAIPPTPSVPRGRRRNRG